MEIESLFSDTNPLHVEHIESAMQAHGLSTPIETTFRRRCPKQDLLLEILKSLRASNFQEEITLVLGNHFKIENPVLLEMTEKRDASVATAASSNQVMIQRLAGSRLSISDLKSFVEKKEVVRFGVPNVASTADCESFPTPQEEEKPRQPSHSPA